MVLIEEVVRLSCGKWREEWWEQQGCESQLWQHSSSLSLSKSGNASLRSERVFSMVQVS